MTVAGDTAFRTRQAGGARTGIVTLRDFDRGVVETLLAEVVGNNYFVQIPGVLPAPGQPGIPVTFGYPEDVLERWKLPAIVISRDDIAPAMQRWHPGMLQYGAPAYGAREVTRDARTGFTGSETLAQATPLDISYTLNLMTTSRGAPGSSMSAGVMLDYVLRIYPPYCAVYVQDSLGDQRTYSAYNESMGMMDDVVDISDRTIAFAVTLRVEAEYDLADPELHSTVTERTVKLQRF
jgi:hypothetical protein